MQLCVYVSVSICSKDCKGSSAWCNENVRKINGQKCAVVFKIHCLKMDKNVFNSETGSLRIRNLSQVRFSCRVPVASLSFKANWSMDFKGAAYDRSFFSFLFFSTAVKLDGHWVNAAFSNASERSVSLGFNRGKAWTWIFDWQFAGRQKQKQTKKTPAGQSVSTAVPPWI